MSFRMLVIAGHGKNMDGSWDPGACGFGYQEANLNRDLAKLIQSAANRNGVSCDIAPDRNYYSFFKNGGKYDFTPYNYVLEVHFNASASTDSGDGVVKGSMMYIDQSETGHTVEDAILNNLYSLGSRKAWDGVVITQRQFTSGLMVQNHVRAQGVSHAVLETCFISDMDDINWYITNKVKIAEAIIDGIKKGFELGDSSSQTNTNPVTSEFKPYMVRVNINDLNIRTGPGTNYAKTGKYTGVGAFTIVAESSGEGSAAGWGKLKSGAGWISLDFATKI